MGTFVKPIHAAQSNSPLSNHYAEYLLDTTMVKVPQW